MLLNKNDFYYYISNIKSQNYMHEDLDERRENTGNLCS